MSRMQEFFTKAKSADLDLGSRFFPVANDRKSFENNGILFVNRLIDWPRRSSLECQK